MFTRSHNENNVEETNYLMIGSSYWIQKVEKTQNGVNTTGQDASRGYTEGGKGVSQRVG
jgi:hypothetical protein